MTSPAVVSGRAPAGSAPPSAWLYGPTLDLLLGAGLAYTASIPLLVWWSARTGATAWSQELAVGLAFAFSAPHYGATLVRVYERRSDRVRYALFSVWFTAAMLALFVLALGSSWLGSLLLTLYVTWSPWHFAGQNYGISLLFLRRRGVAIEPGAKRLLYASFVLSALLAALAVHRAGSSLLFAAGAQDDSRTHAVLRLGVPSELAAALGAAAAVGWALSLLGAARALRRGGAGARDLGVAGAVVATQALWFVLPALGTATGAYSARNLAFAPIWISTAHAVQYLWITCFHARRSDAPVSAVPFLAKALLAGAALTTLPRLLFVPGLLGSQLAGAAGVSVLLFAVVNLHHFVLDGAIWKLRDGRVARVLLRSDPHATGDEVDATRRGWLRPLVWAVGAACLLYLPFVIVERAAATSPSADLARVEGAVRRLAWLGADTPQAWLNLARREERAGRPAEAIAAWRGLMACLRRTDQLPSTEVATHLARLLLRYEAGDPESLAEATRYARWAAQVAPGDATSLEVLAAAHAAAGRRADAEAAAERALARARAAGNAGQAARIERWLQRVATTSRVGDARLP